MSLASKLPWTHRFAGGYPGLSSQPLPTDADAIDYLSRMATADGAGVETGVAVAVDAFFRGLKATPGLFDAIKASCILAGARTLAGALVPIKNEGPELWDAPTPNITGDTGSYDASTRTLSHSGYSQSVNHPRFVFVTAIEEGKQYLFSGRLSGDLAGIFILRLSGSSNVPVDPVTGEFSATITATAIDRLDLWLRGQGYSDLSVTIDSLSIREVIAEPTNVADGFVEGDYSRTAGLTGDGATTYLDSGRANDADGQNDQHMCVFASSAPAGGTECFIGNGSGSLNGSHVGRWGGSPTQFSRSMSTTLSGVSEPYESTGLIGISRNAASSYSHLANGNIGSVSVTSGTPSTGNSFVFARNAGSAEIHTTATLAFYSIGTSLSLADLDTAVTNLITAIGEAL